MRAHLAALAALGLCLSDTARADQNLSPTVSASEIDRFQVRELTFEVVAKVDSMTGATWFLCKDNAKKWCRFEAHTSPLPSGPVGRYALLTIRSTGALLDTVSGRMWLACTPPTPKSILGWCPVEG